MSTRNGILYREVTVGFDENDEPIKKRIGFSFSMNFWNELCRMENVSIAQVDEVFSPDNKRLFETYANVLYCAALAYAEVRDIPFNSNPKIAGEWITEMPQEEFNELIAEIRNTRLFGKNILGLRANKDKAA
jgi:hypothetical protein